MKILSIRTDKPDAEIALFEDMHQLAGISWEAHRQLTDTIHLKLQELLTNNTSSYTDISAIVVYKGPGSFTGLRIGTSVANALSYGLGIPIVSENGDNWAAEGIERLLAGENEKQVAPDYGGNANITKPIK